VPATAASITVEYPEQTTTSAARTHGREQGGNGNPVLAADVSHAVPLTAEPLRHLGVALRVEARDQQDVQFLWCVPGVGR